MTEAKRYDPMGYDKMSGYMDETPLGDYVRAEDYDQLKAQHISECREAARCNLSLREKNAALRAQIDEAHALLTSVSKYLHNPLIDAWLTANKP